MVRVPTSILLDDGLKEEAKKAGLNISRFVEDQLTDFLSKRDLYETAIPALLEEEIEAFYQIAKDRDEWEKFAISRCSMIKNKIGIVVTPHQLIHYVNQKLKKESEREWAVTLTSVNLGVVSNSG